MLQQTQVSRVLEKFDAFLKAFPTISTLARAPEDRVLAAWSGLGYYRRARLLHAAAKAIVQSHNAEVPSSIEHLLELPGIGRYTAGAIASIVFDRPEPIVDGNVARVLLRVHGRDQSAADAQDWLWDRAGALVALAESPARLNEGLMELGAIVCTPISPRCDRCPVRDDCVARAGGEPERFPRAKKRAVQRALHCEVLLCRDARGRVLVERRPTRESGGGLWSGLWQAPTLDMPRRARGASAILKAGGLDPGMPLKRRAAFEHSTTHRRVQFRVWEVPNDWCDALRVARPGAVFRTRSRIARLALSNPQRWILLGDA